MRLFSPLLSSKDKIMRRSYSVGNLVLDIEDVTDSRLPDDWEIDRLKELLAATEKKGTSLLDSVVACANENSNPWINLLLAIVSLDLSQEKDSFLEDFLNDPDWVKEIPGEFSLSVRTFVTEVIWPLKKEYFHVGKNWVKHDIVCQRSAPSPATLSTTWWLFSQMLRAELAIMQILQIAGETAMHPWLVMFFDIAIKKVKEGEMLAQGIRKGVREFHLERIKAISTRSSDELSNCFIPNFLGQFTYDLELIKIGQESALLEKSLDDLSKRHALNQELETKSNPYWSSQVRKFFNDFSKLQDAGLPILFSLQFLQNSGDHAELELELSQVCDEITSGSTLSEAFEKVGKVFSSPLIVAMVRVGESIGTLEVVLAKLSNM